MFIVTQVPFADFRPLQANGRGRLLKPDWNADTPKGFIRGFGKLSPRNSSSIGLTGERSFADMDNAVRFPARIEYKLPDGKGIFRPVPWFRRLYFDGQMAGRFEFGFRVFEYHDDHPIAILNDTEISPSEVAKEVLKSRVQINSVDGSSEFNTLVKSIKSLALAYLAATTNNDALNEFPISETFGTYFLTGDPFVHVRAPSNRKMAPTTDRFVISSHDEPLLFLTSSGGEDPRNNVLVQAAVNDTSEEEPSERVTRVLFAHLNSLIFAYSELGRTETNLKTRNSRDIIKRTLEDMTARLANFTQIDSGKWDADFTSGMQVFGKAYRGRIEDLAAKLEELAKASSKPTLLENVGAYVKGVHDLILKTAVEKTIDISRGL